MLEGLPRIILQDKGTEQIQTMPSVGWAANTTPGNSFQPRKQLQLVVLHKGGTLALGSTTRTMQQQGISRMPAVK